MQEIATLNFSDHCAEIDSVPPRCMTPVSKHDKGRNSSRGLLGAFGPPGPVSAPPAWMLPLFSRVLLVFGCEVRVGFGQGRLPPSVPAQWWCRLCRRHDHAREPACQVRLATPAPAALIGPRVSNEHAHCPNPHIGLPGLPCLDSLTRRPILAPFRLRTHASCTAARSLSTEARPSLACNHH